jgi:two-component system OmpR family response regulator/two-component system response regulator QseB
MRVLLVEDDDMIGDSVRKGLRHDGFAIDWVRDGEAAIHAVTAPGAAMGAAGAEPGATMFDLMLLDLGLPKRDGLEVVREVRQRGIPIPILILTARDAVADRVAGLNAGADDYLVKPFDLAELSARIGSVARRYSGNPNPLLHHGPLDIDLAARRVVFAGKPVQLTAREWALLEAFLSRPGQLLTKSQLEEKLYAFDSEVESNAIEVHVSRLRKKLGPGIVETERGLGYRLGKP